MTHPRLRLAVAAFLFLGWIGYLVFLVVRTREPVILSRPQLLHSDLVVLAEIKEINGKPQAEVTVRDTLWSGQPSRNPKAQETLWLPELADCGKDEGWRGPGEYLLFLRWEGMPVKGQPAKDKFAKDKPAGDNPGAYRLTSLPRSPNFYPRWQVEMERAKINPAVQDWIVKNTQRTREDLARQDEFLLLGANLDFLAVNDWEKQLWDVLEVPEQDRTPLLRRSPGDFRIYLATPDAREQLKRLKE